GLWNSREIAGYGVGSIFLTRAAVAISTQIGLTSLFALCAPYTVKMAESVGYQLETRVGNKGTFYYPKLDMMTTTMILHEHDSLTNADTQEQEAIIRSRNQSELTRIENLRRKEIEIEYKTKVPLSDDWNIQDLIKNLMKNPVR